MCRRGPSRGRDGAAAEPGCRSCRTCDAESSGAAWCGNRCVIAVEAGNKACAAGQPSIRAMRCPRAPRFPTAPCHRAPPAAVSPVNEGPSAWHAAPDAGEQEVQQHFRRGPSGAPAGDPDPDQSLVTGASSKLRGSPRNPCQPLLTRPRFLLFVRESWVRRVLDPASSCARTRFELSLWRAGPEGPGDCGQPLRTAARTPGNW